MESYEDGFNDDDMFVDSMIETYINERSGAIIYSLTQRMEHHYPQVARFAHVFADHAGNDLALDCFALAIKVIEDKYGEPFCQKCSDKNLSDKLIDKYLHGHSHQNILLNLIPAMETNHPDIAKIADAFGVHIRDQISSEVFAVTIDVYEHVMRHEEDNLTIRAKDELDEAMSDYERAIGIAEGKINPTKK